MPDTSRLSDADRSKLDAIVFQMETNKESPDTIQTLVNDFKQKYAKPPTFWETHPQTASLARGALNTLPLVGMAGGTALAAPAALASGPAAPLVDMAGAGLGAGAGTGARNFLAQELGLEKPTGLTEATRDVGQSAVGSALMQGALPATGRAARGAVRATARGTGDLVETTGKAARFPAQLVGSSRLLGGLGARSGGTINPVGAAIIAAPRLLEKAGAALKAWGEADPAFMAKTVEGFVNPKDPATEDLTKAEQRVLRMADPKNPAIRARILGTTKVGKEANRDFEEAMVKRNLSRYDELQEITANKAREGAIEKAKQGLEAKPPVVNESISTTDKLGRRANVRTSYGPPAPAAIDADAQEAAILAQNKEIEARNAPRPTRQTPTPSSSPASTVPAGPPRRPQYEIDIEETRNAVNAKRAAQKAKDEAEAAAKEAAKAAKKKAGAIRVAGPPPESQTVAAQPTEKPPVTEPPAGSKSPVTKPADRPAAESKPKSPRYGSTQQRWSKTAPIRSPEDAEVFAEWRAANKGAPASEGHAVVAKLRDERAPGHFKKAQEAARLKE